MTQLSQSIPGYLILSRGLRICVELKIKKKKKKHEPIESTTPVHILPPRPHFLHLDGAFLVAFNWFPL
jgi:hypothetical protein